MLKGCEYRKVAVGGLDLNVALTGDGPPLLLLHGYPQTHYAWHRVVPQLRGFRLVIPDSPGYGASKGPPADGGSHNYSKRNIARLMVALMEALGHERFHFAGHDRGARVGYRLALDAPERLDRLALLDIIPTGAVWQRMRAEAAHRSFHWPFLAQPAPFPEKVIAACPEAFVGGLLKRWTFQPNALDPAACAAYVEQFRNEKVIEATCEDYRAGFGIDRVMDDNDHAAGRRIAVPTLVLWAERYLFDPEAIWREWCERVTVTAFDCGHFIAEERPAECAAALNEFFAG